MNKIYFYPISLGCVKNQVDFEYLFFELKQFDWIIVKSVDKADVIIINTCAFIKDALEESINEILTYIMLNKKVIVTGCLTQRYKEQMKKLFPEINIFTGTESAIFAKDINRLFRENKGKVLINNSLQYNEFPKRILMDRFHTYIKISEGCNRECAFCLIPKIRGKYRSRKIENIVEEVKMLYKRGFREFNIISEDTSLYGIDLYGKRKIIDLIEILDELKYKDIYFRLLYVYPDKYIYKIIDSLYNTEHFIKYIDMPLQHVSKKILKKMNRVYINADRLVKYINNKNIILRTSFIVGFPYENEYDFKKLYDFVENGYIDKMGIFTYSRQDNTKAFNYNNRVHYKTALKRKRLLFELQESIVYNKMKNYIGKTKIAVLHEYNKKNNEYYGRLLEDMNEIDNVLIVKNNKKYKLNTTIKIKIKKINNMMYYA